MQRAYGYVYDPLNRLLQGDFVARNASLASTPNTLSLWKSEEDNYRLSFASYDDNGNLRTLRRRGLLANATHATAKQFGPVDHLSYAYAGNRLQAVDDAVSTNQLPRPRGDEGAPSSLAGDFQESGTHLGQEYGYDANGNLTQDRNKGISGIAYNHLNLPRLIHFGIGADSLVFRYTAAGQKVAKLVYQTGKPVQRTDYLGPYQYEQDSLRFFPHAEGRVLRFANTTSGAVRYEREFSFKDHLGNLRLAYRAGQVRTLTATLEPDAATHGRESQQFDSLSVSAPIAVPTGLARTGGYAARLNAGGATPHPLGPLTQLTVQKGDTLFVTAPGRYPQATGNHAFAFSLAGFVAALLQPAPGGPAGVDGARRGGLPLLQVGLSSATLLGLSQLPGGVPKGYLRVLSFNEDSVLVDQRTVQLSAAALNNYETLRTGQLLVQQNGYVSVYVGNESAADVYFDDVTIEHRQGLQVQENQYDPFGLDLAGLTRNTPGLKPLNQYKFNGKEFQADLGLNWNHQDWRFFDTQLGRWHVTDPELENGQESWSPYSFGFDNAVRYADADGRCPDGCPPGVLPAPSFLERASKAMDLAGLLHDLRETPMIGPEMNMASGLITGLQELLTLATLTPTPTAQPQSTALPSDRAYSPPVAHAGSQAASQLSTTSSSRPARRVGQEAHKNSLSSNAPQHGYRILNKDGKVMEYGISSQALSKKGTSPRVASKLAEKYGNAAGYHGEVLNPSIQPTREGQTTREAAVEWEKTQVNDYARQNAAGEGPPRQDLPKPKL